MAKYRKCLNNFLQLILVTSLLNCQPPEKNSNVKNTENETILVKQTDLSIGNIMDCYYKLIFDTSKTSKTSNDSSIYNNIENDTKVHFSYYFSGKKRYSFNSRNQLISFDLINSSNNIISFYFPENQKLKNLIFSKILINKNPLNSGFIVFDIKNSNCLYFNVKNNLCINLLNNNFKPTYATYFNLFKPTISVKFDSSNFLMGQYSIFTTTNNIYSILMKEILDSWDLVSRSRKTFKINKNTKSNNLSMWYFGNNYEIELVSDSTTLIW